MCLAEVAKWYTANPDVNHPIGPGALVSRELAEKYLFWALRLLGVPASSTSPNSALQVLAPQFRLTLYHHTTAFFLVLFKVPSITVQEFPPSLKPILSDVAIAWWTSLVDGDPPIYPLGKRDNPEHNVSSVDGSTRLFNDLVVGLSNEVAAAIMDGRICSPETFVSRTIGRMKPLVNLCSLRHLSDLPPVTVEASNMIMIAAASIELARCEPRLHRLFMEKGAPGAYMKPISILGDVMETTVRTGMTRATIPSNPLTGSCYIGGCLSLGAMIMGWLNSSNTDVLRQVKDVVANGAVQLVFSGAVLLRPSEDRGFLDNIFDVLTFYAPYAVNRPFYLNHGPFHASTGLKV
jgi:hypothetical protein